MQETVDRLRSYGLQFVQCGATHSSHIHPPLKNVLNLVGKTDNVRDFWNIILHSEGVICPVTGAMHIAAAFNKPCVVIAGGREEPWFEAYVNNFSAFGPGARNVKVRHKFLHTIGKLPCCDVQGCWKKRVVPLDNNDITKKSHTLCSEPVRPEHTHAVPRCLDLIEVDHVVEAVMDYYDEGTLPPIGEPKKKYPELADEEALVSEAPRETVKAPPAITIPDVEIRRAPPVGAVPELVRTPSVESKTQRPHQQIHPAEATLQAEALPRKPKILDIDNPIIGGRFTVCVLCYGDHVDLAKRCIDSIVKTVDLNHIDLRIGGNKLGSATMDYLQTVPANKLYLHTENDKKYPVTVSYTHLRAHETREDRVFRLLG